jgi:hypothetical protein
MSEMSAGVASSTAPRPSEGDLATLLRRLGVRFSGVYDYNGGAGNDRRVGGNRQVTAGQASRRQCSKTPSTTSRNPSTSTPRRRVTPARSTTVPSSCTSTLTVRMRYRS